MMQKKSNIIVIGAGIAGLAAANFLKTKGHTVQILEARDRVGGRIWQNFSLGIPLDCGASWIHGKHNNPLMELAQKYHANLIETDRGKIHQYDENNKHVPQAIRAASSENFQEILEAIYHYAEQQKKPCSLWDAFQVVIKENERFNRYQNYFSYELEFISQYMGAELQDLSALCCDPKDDFPEDNYFLSNSFKSIIEGLAHNLEIQFNTVVEAILQDQAGVIIKTNRGEMNATKVIVTVPLGILKANKIKFIPELPSIKITAINHLKMGLLNKLFLKFPQSFWPEDSYTFSIFDKDRNKNTLFSSLSCSSNAPILIRMISGKTAEFYEMQGEKFVEDTVKILKDFFGHSIPDPELTFQTRWKQDEFSLGSYSYLGLNATPEDCLKLAAPIDNKIFFAGEATIPHPLATAHGAYKSGERAAMELIETIA